MRSAQQGNATAEANVAGLYFNGRGVTQDYVKSVQWYEKAAAKGNSAAQNSLGEDYSMGGASRVTMLRH